MNVVRMIAGVAIIGIAACQGEHRELAPRQAPALRGTGTVPPRATAAVALSMTGAARRPTSPTEDSLIAALVAHYPGARGDLMRSVLYNPQATLRPIDSAPPDVQQLVAEIAAIRQSRVDSTEAAHHAFAPYDATVALVPRLPTADSTATAVILRRITATPHDIVLLPASAPTLGAYGSAIRALVLARRSEGDMPTRNEVILVHGDSVPRGWRGTGFGAMAARDLASLRSAAPSQLHGVGIVPALTIKVSPTHPRP